MQKMKKREAGVPLWKSSIHKEKQEKEKGTRELQNSQRTINKMLLVITTLHVNGLHFTIERFRELSG